MALFSSRKRQDPPVLAAVGEAASALPAPAQPAQFSSAPLGASLRLVTASTPEPTAPVAAEQPTLPEGPRAEDLRGLPLGTILFRQGLVEQQDLEEALGAGMETGERLGEVLIRRDLVTQDDIGRGLAAQQGLAFLHEDELALDTEIASLLPADEARALGAVAVRNEGDTVLVVTADPSARQRERLENRLERSVTEAVVSRGVFDRLVEAIDGGAELHVFTPVVVASEPDEPVEEEVFDLPPAADTHEIEPPAAEAVLEPVADEAADEPTIDAADDPELRHEPQEVHQMEQVWTDVDSSDANNEPEAEAWPEPTTPEEIWGAATTQQVEEAHADPEHVEAEAHVEPSVEEHTHFEDQSFEAPASYDGGEHEASLGRIDDLLARIHEGASTFGDLRSQIDGLSETLRTTEETLADRERHIAELVQEHEGDQRRIEELVGQLGEREEALHGLGARVEELTGRLGSAEERLDERERRLAELDATLGERMQHADELSRQLEQRDNALSSFEEKLSAIAAQFSA